MASAASVLDRSVVALRRGGVGLVARALAAGGIVAWVAISAYYLDEVEGVRSLRPLFGVVIALAFALRGYLLAGVARSIVAPLLPSGTDLPEIRFADVARTSSIVAIGLFFWLWLPILGSYIAAPSAAILVLPLCVRGAVAPTWIARAGAAPEGGVPAFRLAFDDLGTERWKGVLVELFLILGGIAIYLNLLAATAAIGLFGRSFLGMDVADLETFFSARNSFVLLSLAAVSAVALEPLRAATSALLYVESRARREGFDLEAAVHRLVRAPSRGAAAVVLALSIAIAAGAEAQAPLPAEPPAEVAEQKPEGALTDRDWAVQERVEDALARSEFEEHSGVAPGQSLRDLLARFFEWLFGDRDLDLGPTEKTNIPMPPAWVFGVFFAALAAILLVVALRERSRSGGAASRDDEVAEREPDPRDRPPEAHLDEAARLAAAGAYREAFRALYLATLVALDRRGAIAFDRSRTNWHYLRSMASGPTREAFHRFTALFDRKWYGDESTSELEYRLGRELADRLCAAEPETVEGAAP